MLSDSSTAQPSSGVARARAKSASTQSDSPTIATTINPPLEATLARSRRFIAPIGTYAIQGLAAWQDGLVALDAVRGHLLHIDLRNDCPTILNPYCVQPFLGARGLAIQSGPVLRPPYHGHQLPPVPGEPTSEVRVWFTRDRSVYSCRLSDLQTSLPTGQAVESSQPIEPIAGIETIDQSDPSDRIEPINPSNVIPGATAKTTTSGTVIGPRAGATTADRLLELGLMPDSIVEHWVELPYTLDGIAVWKSTIYASSRRAGCIYVIEAETGQLLTRFYAPGIGESGLCAWGEELWVADKTEQTVFCLDRATGSVLLSAITPYESPTALAFCPDPDLAADRADRGLAHHLFVAYASEESYIRDEPNDPDEPFKVAWRDRTGFHALDVIPVVDRRCVLSNGYRVEMFYAEEIAPLEDVNFSKLENFEWRIALPSDTDRQAVQKIEPVGLPFTEEMLPTGQRLARFDFASLRPGEGRIFGWKATLDLRGIRYQLTPRDVEALPTELPEGFAERYLVDNDDLAMDTPIMRSAALEAIGSETNLLRKILAIRNYAYDRLSYRLQPRIDTPDIALARGTACCGEYVGVLLALARLNGIACRTVGRYKCPAPADRLGVPLYPDYNHVWLEFYLPGFGWLPMESNPDDIQEGGPYPTRYFMALPWNHVEIAKGIRFQSLTVAGLPIPEISMGDLAMNHVRFRILQELPAP